MTFLGALAQFLRYEIVMPQAGALRTGELCVVIDRWTGEAKPCTDQALYKQERKRAEPRQAEKSDRGEALWRRVAGLLIELLEIERWLPNMTSRI